MSEIVQEQIKFINFQLDFTFNFVYDLIVNESNRNLNRAKYIFFYLPGLHIVYKKGYILKLSMIKGLHIVF